MSTEPRRKPGPKPRLGETIRVTVNIQIALIEAIDREADTARVSRSEIIRRRLS